MDRATEAAANDLAEVRKLIEGMNALVNSQQAQQQAQQQQAQQQQAQQAQQQLQKQQKQQAQQAQQQQIKQQQQQQQQQQQLQQAQQAQQQAQQVQQQQSQPQLAQSNVSSSPRSLETSQSWSPQPNTQTENNSESNASTFNSNTQTTTTVPTSGIIIEVNHLSFTRTLYFQLSPDATIEPLVAWLKLSFQDNSISGMVLQYKGFDGLWKCLLNRDDSLKRVLKQSLKNNTMLQMRVPREQDLLSSGYTDKRLLALTTRPTTE